MIKASPSKFELVCDEIYRLAQKSGANGKLPTVAQLCATLQVTIVTLNTALTEMERRGVIYRRRGSGIYVSPDFGRKSIVLLCHPAFFQADAPPFWTLLVERISQQAEARQETFSLHFVSNREEDSPIQESLQETIRDGRVHGILGIGLTPLQTEQIESLEIPYVGYAGPGQYTVVQDLETLLDLATNELSRQGCRNVGMWSFVPPYRPREDVEAYLKRQQESFQRIWRRCGWEALPERLRDNAVLIDNPGGMTTMSRHEQGYRTAIEALSSNTRGPLDGVIITSESVARGALIALRNIGVTPGKDIRIATHKDAESSVLIGFEDCVIPIEYEPQEVVSGLFDLLETLMDGEKPEQEVVHITPRLRHVPAGTVDHNERGILTISGT